MEPTEDEILNLKLNESLPNIATWVGLSVDEKSSLAAVLGYTLDEFAVAHPRVFASVLPTDLDNALQTWEINGTSASLIQKGKVQLLHRAARYVLGADSSASISREIQNGGPSDIANETAKGVAQALADASRCSQRKVKMSLVIDPTDDTDVPVANEAQVNTWFKNYAAAKGGWPLPEYEPTTEQISALETRIVTLFLEPYADFSILTPYGRRMAKVLRHRSWLLQEDGTYKPVEVPGPADFKTWSSCWKVYSSILLMIWWPASPEYEATPVVAVQDVENYYENFRRLCNDHPETWHLCCTAEDRCRAEHFPRIKRQLESDYGRWVSWSEVFRAAALDNRYWDNEVRNPSLAFLARGKTPSATAAVQPGQTFPTMPLTKGQKKRLRQQQQQQSLEAGSAFKVAKRDASGTSQPVHITDHPKKDKKGRYVSDAQGNEICFRYHNPKVGCKEPCPNNRAHLCQNCLGKHPNSDCPKRK